MALSRELTVQKLEYVLRVSGPWSLWVWSELGPEKTQGGGSRMTVWLGRSGPRVPCGAGRVGILGLGRVEDHLDLRMELDLLGKREKCLFLESSSLWGVGHQVQGSESLGQPLTVFT